MATKLETVVNQTLWTHLLSNGCVRRRWIDAYAVEAHGIRREFNGGDLLGSIVTLDLEDDDVVSPVWLYTPDTERPANVLLYTDDPTPHLW